METKGLDHQIFEKYLELLSNNAISNELIQTLRESLGETTKPEYQQIKSTIEAFLCGVGNEN